MPTPYQCTPNQQILESVVRTITAKDCARGSVFKDTVEFIVESLNGKTRYIAMFCPELPQEQDKPLSWECLPRFYPKV